MLDYDTEAARYDATRGGTPRAEAAADAVLRLVPPSARTLLDIGCGTGLVTERIALGRPGLRVFGADAAYGMARLARQRVGAVALADVRTLPLATGTVDAVSAVWLLHLLRGDGVVREVVAEAARVLRPGGVFVATVDKDAGHDVGSDIDAVLAPYLSARPADAADLVTGYARHVGLEPAGDAGFAGHGQGRSPRRTAGAVLRGDYASRLTLPGTAATRLAEQLLALPDPDTPRADPVYRLLAFRTRG
ncbi:class I SAM-dependent methyltransferase [Streptomyces sp. NBC_01460]|uniref:class I SAM-dependent methyltransferase n=1 Tax=Streptomyces sp. NBC_01460 TaxID=2903875 RepID=UPI002E30FFC5|nr:class I SAM-dependent methyltransferase [Streptomyces sp. NBC_01460]